MSDIVFSSPLVVDGTSKEPFVADVKVSGERISQIGKILPKKSDRVIPAKGLVLAPGFVDAHSHSDYHLLILPSAESKILQGITTEIGGNCGYSPAPVFGKLAGEREKSLSQEYSLKKSTFRELKDFLKELDELKIALNFAPLVGYNTIRASVMGFENRPPSKTELKKIQNEIEKALLQGAFGVSAGLIYPPGCYASKDELVEALAPLREAGGVFACHIRSEGDKLIEAVSELIEIGKKAGVRIQLSHIKTSGPRNWHKLDKVFELVENAQKHGLNIMADRYPYTASFTSLSAVLPEWVFEGGEEKYRERLRKERDKIKSEILKRYDGDYWRRVIISQSFEQGWERIEGKSIAQIAEEEKKPPCDILLEILYEHKISPSAIFRTMSEENLERIYAKNWVVVGSDAGARSGVGILAQGKPHPRAYGTFPKFFKEFVREKKLVSLKEAVRKTSALACEHFQIKERGKILEGYFADLVLFDPEKISDRADYENPFLPPVGIKLVMVAGRVVVEDGKITGEFSGKTLRK